MLHLQVVQALRSQAIPFKSFDILEVTTFLSFGIFPQPYVDYIGSDSFSGFTGLGTKDNQNY